MSNINELISTLQHTLKQQKVTYSMLAKKLGLSESSVKRMFSKGDMKLTRLQQICDIIGLDMSELAMLAIEGQRNVHRLEKKQEQDLIQDPRLMLLAYLLTVGWTVPEVLESYEYTQTNIIRLLARLDKMKLIDLLPDNRVRLRLARDFQWRENGAIERFFTQQVQKEFFNADFDSGDALRLVNNGYLSRSSFVACQQKMLKLKQEIDEFIKSDQGLDKKHLLPITHITAIRPWVFSMFDHYRR